jgi:predicted nucleic acid-binding protein
MLLFRVNHSVMRLARLQARLWTHLAVAGLPIGERELLNAATALARGYDMLTENLREFRRVPGLVIRQPVW